MKQFELTILVQTEKDEEAIENLLDLFGDIIDLSADVTFYASWFEDITEDEDRNEFLKGKGLIGG